MRVIGFVMCAIVIGVGGVGGIQPECRVSGSLGRIDGLSESSGVAVSRSSAGRLWTHNDSGDPVIFALTGTGSVAGKIQLTGVKVEDWEAIAVGPCTDSQCIYVGDIGDNNASRRQVTVYRFPEAAGAGSPVAVKDVFHATYPDGAQDAETLLVSDGRLFIVTKGETGPVSLYRFPKELRAGMTHRLERVGNPRGSGKPTESERVTDGAVSPDGTWVALRSKQRLWLYRAVDLFQGKWTDAREVDLSPLDEPQGEGVAIGADGTIYLTGEGGGLSRSGTFAKVSCSSKRFDGEMSRWIR